MEPTEFSKDDSLMSALVAVVVSDALLYPSSPLLESTTVS